ncbi:XRE family transcriptional regulator [Streptomyces sp. NPDC093568]|uniref:XRE family transcriptional regulator n=1 Tax=Streptomyces sp. NPDC093568 TaxID=3366041 RepID=UPI00381E82A5
MTFMGNRGELSPHEARDAAGLVASMQRLKERSGLTYRELEQRAARSGDVLARSTLADTLRRRTLPRPDVLAAFVRACGDGQQVGAWLDARNRIASDAAAPDREAGEVQPEPEENTDARPRRAKGRTVAPAASLMIPLLALAAWGLLPDRSDDQVLAPPDGWVTIRPARSPDLCLTDGRDRDGAYASAVAVQLPCAQATVPRTYLEPVGEGLFRIQWHHPQEGKGCLTLMTAGPAQGMLEPRNNCAPATLFRLEATTAGSTEGFRLRLANSSQCIGISDTGEGAEATERRCGEEAGQRFLIQED